MFDLAFKFLICADIPKVAAEKKEDAKASAEFRNCSLIF